MDDLTPPVLLTARELRWRIASGQSMKEAMRLYLSESATPFAHKLREWWIPHLQGHGSNASAFSSHYQRSLVDLVARGCAGQPTLEHLCALEEEIERAAQAELEQHISTLPFKVLLPLLLLQFPAYLLLLLGPLLRDLSAQMGGG